MAEGKKVTSSKFVKWFSKVGSGHLDLAGEKGANLGELFSLKLPVPNGFVVTTKAYDYFLDKSGIKDKISSFLSQIDVNNREQLDNYVSNIKDLILKAEFPEDLKEDILESYENLGADKLEIEHGSALDILNSAAEPVFVAVRSSLPFEKIHKTNNLREQDTYLNVKGNDALLSHVKKCFVSLFNVETVKRCLSEGSDKFKIAVVVQSMIQGDKSGVIYSKNNSNEIFVKAIWGLGEGMNVKDIIPDQYVLSKKLEVLDKKINEKAWGVVRDASGSLKKIKLSPERSACPVLADYEIQRLGDLAEKIEKHFDSPQEIEFVIEDDIYVVQTRKLEEVTEEVKEEIVGEKKEEKVDKEKEEIKVEEKVQGNIGRVEKVTKTKLKLVVDSSHFLEDYRETGLKKIGFLKIENIIKESGKHPKYYLSGNYVNEYENVIYRGIKPIVEAFEEIWMRTSDFRSDEFKDLEGAPKIFEKNPALGLHGIRYGLKNLDILESELLALKRVSIGRTIGILIPGIVSVDELKEVKSLLEKIEFRPKIGIIVETPSAVQLIKDFTEEGIDRILIETNDLIQNLLCIDLDNKELDYLYDSMHPALMYQLEYVIRVCKRRDIETSISGKALLNDELLKFLIQKEIASICVKAELAKDFSEKIDDFEKEFFAGTDKEPRQYEIKKAKEDILSRDNDKEVPKTMEDLKALEESEKVSIPVSPEVQKDIELIEAEKKEYEENGVLEGEKVDLEKQDEGEELVEEESIEDAHRDDEEEAKEHPEEEFDNSPEEHEEESTGNIVSDVDEAVEAIKEEKKEYLKEHPEEKKDDLEIF